MNDAEFTAEALSSIPGVSVRRGVFAGVDQGMGLVDMGESRFPADFGIDHIPVAGDMVQVLSVGPRHMIFPAGAKPRVGTVLTVGEERCTLQTVTGDLSAIIAGETPSSGDRVLIEWTEDGPVSGLKLATTPDVPEPPAPPAPPSSTKTVTFRAVSAGATDRHQVRFWSPNPQAGNTTFGFWFYEAAIKNTIPANAQFVSMQFKVNRTRDSGGPPRFVLHNQTNPGAVLPGISSFVEWDPPQGWHTPPNAADWFSALKAGGAYAGIGLNQGGYSIFASLAQDAESGALRITWRT